MASPQPGQNPYTATTPPPYASRVDEASTAYGAPARTGRNGMGTAALVLGILSLITCWIWFVGGVLAVLAIIFGVIGRNRVARGEASNRGSALAGLVTGILGLIATVAIVIAAVTFLNSSTGKCVQNNQGNQSAQQQCLK